MANEAVPLGQQRISDYLVKILIAAGAAMAIAAVVWVFTHRSAPTPPLYLIVRLPPDLDPNTQRYLNEITKPRPTTVLPGEDFRQVVSRYYGYFTDELGNLVRTANPRQATFSLGQHVLLPAAPRFGQSVTIAHTEPGSLLLRELAERETGTSGETTKRAVEAANPLLRPDAWNEPVQGSVTIPLPTFGVYQLKTGSTVEAKLKVSQLERMSDRHVLIAEITTGYRVVPNWTLASSAATGAGSSHAPTGWPFQTLPADMSKMVQTFKNTPVVAVVDTGIAQSDSRFDKVLWKNSNPGTVETLGLTETTCMHDEHGCNFMTLDGFPEDDCQVPADYNHGTHAAGLVSARLSQAKDALDGHLELMVLKVADRAGQIDPGKLGNAIRYATATTKRRANIVNLSLIGQGDTNVTSAISEATQTLFVVAAGNSNTGQGTDLKDAKAGDAVVPAIMSNDPNGPHGNVITVAAQDPAGDLSAFSNFGRTLVDLAAPGSEVRSTVSGGGIRSESGTSQAAALVSLAAALLYAEGLTDPSDIKSRLITSSDYHAAFQDKILSGGSLNIQKALLYRQDLVQLRDGTPPLQGKITFPLKIDVDDKCNDPDPLALGTSVKKIALHTAGEQMSRVMYIKSGALVTCDGVGRISHVEITTDKGPQDITADRIADIIPAVER